ncbi:MAG: protein kinase [Vicinamibacterales bacterium]
MTLTPGTRLGVYEVTAVLGTGGMGEVYRARDTRLGRDVALKVLLPAVANDPDRLARFTREAQTLAALNHPHIAQIYGVEESDGVRALVMELVEGQTLADRLARGPVPLDEALPIARQIADALEAAHEQGIIHRDLKPANIVVRADGTVKVLDFGLAKALDPAGTSAVHPADSPTVTSPALTHAGIILGTAAYMAPEQARGQLVDRRADLWAFGVVLIEMLTGTRLFEGATVSDTLAAVLTKTPNWSLLAATPTPVRTLLRRCIERDRGKRLDSAAAARLDIEDALATPASNDKPASAAVGLESRRSRRLTWFAAGLAVALAVVAALPWQRAFDATPTPHVVRLQLAPPDGVDFDDAQAPAIAPEGERIAFVGRARDTGRESLFVRRLDSLASLNLPGTENATFPFWSPDGRSLAFFADEKLKSIDVASGTVRVLCPATHGVGGSWSPSGEIAFVTALGPIHLLSAVGGDPSIPWLLTEGEVGQFHPQFLADGRLAFWRLGVGAFIGRTGDPESALSRTDSYHIASRGRRVRPLENCVRIQSGRIAFCATG